MKIKNTFIIVLILILLVQSRHIFGLKSDVKNNDTTNLYTIRMEVDNEIGKVSLGENSFEETIITKTNENLDKLLVSRLQEESTAIEQTFGYFSTNMMTDKFLSVSTLYYYQRVDGKSLGNHDVNQCFATLDMQAGDIVKLSDLVKVDINFAKHLIQNTNPILQEGYSAEHSIILDWDEYWDGKSAEDLLDILLRSSEVSQFSTWETTPNSISKKDDYTFQEFAIIIGKLFILISVK